jgi:hypothetical protein
MDPYGRKETTDFKKHKSSQQVRMKSFELINYILTNPLLLFSLTTRMTDSMPLCDEEAS